MSLRRFLMLLALLSGAGCSRQDGGVSTHVPVSVGGITYDWPSDGSFHPSKSANFALIPERMWNATVGVIPSASFHTGEPDLTIWLGPARSRTWAVASDGSGLPLSDGERFVVAARNPGYTIGQVRGPGIVDPGSYVIFTGEPHAYVQCTRLGAGRSEEACILLMNDRGVQHTLPVRWGAWADVPAELRLYRQLVGAPTNSAI